MSTHKGIDKICVAAVIFSLLITAFMFGLSTSQTQADTYVQGYENRLFDTSTVHEIYIVMDDWDSFIENCEDEEYVACTVIIDGEKYKNVAIRAKGNTSLSTVSQMDSQRYSFKIEFDHYQSGLTYHGLDKLCLNNIIQDNTYMKDYLTYRLMDEFGVDSPLCSYAYINVNGEEWGLYLAVEAVEDAFLNRNYGGKKGDLYKPDSTGFGGGRGNGQGFDMDQFMADREEADISSTETDQAEPEQMLSEESQSERERTRTGGGQMPGGMKPPEGGDRSENMTPPDGFEMPDGFEIPEDMTEFMETMSEGMEGSGGMGGPGGVGGPEEMAGGGGKGMNSSDVKLQYINDDPDSYSNIFDNAKTKVTNKDKTRLIEALKNLSAQDNLKETVNIEEVIRYFVVHLFVCNDDSYTGQMIHNYYLYEEDGQLSMIPWDYNLAFGGFSSSDSATSLVNRPIDTPISSQGSGDSSDTRPMIDWILENQEYLELYHEYYQEFLEQYFSEDEMVQMVEETWELIAPYVKKDPTKFCTYEEAETGVETLKKFISQRGQSIRGQLDGTIPSTTTGQSEDTDSLIDASDITISDMGSMNAGGQGPEGRDGFPGDDFSGTGFPGHGQRFQNGDFQGEDRKSAGGGS